MIFCLEPAQNVENIAIDGLDRFGGKPLDVDRNFHVLRPGARAGRQQYQHEDDDNGFHKIPYWFEFLTGSS